MSEVTVAQFQLALSIGRFAREGRDPDLFPSESVDLDRVDLNRMLESGDAPREERERRYRQVAYAAVGSMPVGYAPGVIGYLADYGFLRKRDAGAIAARVSWRCAKQLLQRYNDPDIDIYYGVALESPGRRFPDEVESRLLTLAVDRQDMAMAIQLTGCKSAEDFVRFAATVPEPAALLRRLLARCDCEIPPDVWETLPQTVQNELSPYVPVLESLSKRTRTDL